MRELCGENARRVHNARDDEVEYEHREDAPQREPCAALFRPAHHEQREKETDRHDHQRTRQLHNRRIRARIVTVRIARRDHGRRIVDRRARPHAEALIGHPHRVPEEWKEKDRNHVKEENRRNRDYHIPILCPDHRGDRRNRRAAADRRPRADERRHIAIEPHQAPYDKRRKERRRERKDHHVEGLLAHLHDMKEIHLKAEQNDRILENLLARKADAALRLLRPPLFCEQHPEQNAEHGAAHDGEIQPQHVGRHGKQHRIEDAVHVLSFHRNPSFKTQLRDGPYANSSAHSASRKPTNTRSFVMRSGRFTSIPSEASAAYCCSADIFGSLSFSPRSR